MTSVDDPVASARPTGRRRASVSTLLGSLGNIVVVAAQSILLTPQYLRRIGDHLFGAWLASGDALVWMQALDLGLPNLMIQRVGAADARADAVALGRWLANGLAALGLVAALIAGTGAMLSARLPALLGVQGTEGLALSRAFFVSAIATAFAVLNNGVVGYSRGVQRTGFLNASMVLGSLAGFGTSVALLLNGFGLMAIAWGIAARSSALLAGSAVFLAREISSDVWRAFRLDWPLIRELGRTLPATAVGGLSHAALNQSELALLATVLSPERAAVYMVTRRGAEMARALADAVTFSSYGAFAHLVTSNDRGRSPLIYSEILALRTTIAVALGAAFIAANPGFVTVWVGRDHFIGLFVSALIGLQSVVTGSAFLTNYLFRATGDVVKGSVALAVEAVLRVSCAIALVLTLGPAGIPIAAISTALVFGYLAHQWTLAEISKFASLPPRASAAVWMSRVALLVAACLVSRLELPSGWLAPLGIGAAFALAGTALLLVVDSLGRGFTRDTGLTLVELLRPR